MEIQPAQEHRGRKDGDGLESRRRQAADVQVNSHPLGAGRLSPFRRRAASTSLGFRGYKLMGLPFFGLLVFSSDIVLSPHNKP